MNVKVTIKDGIGTLVMSLPPLNIVTREVLRHIRERLEELAAEPTLRVVLFRSEGKHFSAGADVGEHMPGLFEEMIPEFMQTVTALRDFPLPVVAAVQGRCLGGGFELVQGADLIVAGETATFGQPEILLGVTAPAASVLLPMICPTTVAAEILFTGEALPATEARHAGLVARVVPDDRIEEMALELCGRIARHSGAALRTAKRMLRAGERAARTAAFAEAERLYVQDLMQTGDAVEGLTAFLEKRKPVWSHQ